MFISMFIMVAGYSAACAMAVILGIVSLSASIVELLDNKTKEHGFLFDTEEQFFIDTEVTEVLVEEIEQPKVVVDLRDLSERELMALRVKINSLLKTGNRHSPTLALDMGSVVLWV